jgi:hypothetical protein
VGRGEAGVRDAVAGNGGEEVEIGIHGQRVDSGQ